MKVIVTGGAGFIGSHIVDSYIKAGHDVVVIDNLSSGNRQNVNRKAVFYQMDIRAPEVDGIIKKEKPVIINHHAAQKSVPKSVVDPVIDGEINIIGLIHLLNAAAKHKVKKFIFASSGGALSGDTPIIPTPEDITPVMSSPYAVSKYSGEQYLKFYAGHYGLKYTVLRYANVYGPRQNMEGECGVIPIFIDNMNKNQPSRLFAYPDMPKGTTRDYVYIDDVCTANLLALDKGDNEILHIGTGAETPIADVYNLVQEEFSKKLPLIRERERKGDVKRSALNPEKARRILGWEPKVPLKEGIQKTLSVNFMTNPCFERESKLQGL